MQFKILLDLASLEHFSPLFFIITHALCRKTNHLRTHPFFFIYISFPSLIAGSQEISPSTCSFIPLLKLATCFVALALHTSLKSLCIRHSSPPSPPPPSSFSMSSSFFSYSVSSSSSSSSVQCTPPPSSENKSNRQTRQGEPGKRNTDFFLR